MAQEKGEQEKEREKMIFASKNEDGVPAWKQVVDGTKTVTRRLKASPVGAYRSVQPKRCKKGVGFVRIVNCIRHTNWILDFFIKYKPSEFVKELDLEAQREGFKTWEGVLKWFDSKNIDIDDTYVLSLSYIKKNPEVNDKKEGRK